MNDAEFDRHAATYNQLHQTNIALTGEEPAYFADYKMRDFKALLERAGLPLRTRHPEALLLRHDPPAELPLIVALLAEPDHRGAFIAFTDDALDRTDRELFLLFRAEETRVP